MIKCHTFPFADDSGLNHVWKGEMCPASSVIHSRRTARAGANNRKGCQCGPTLPVQRACPPWSGSDWHIQKSLAKLGLITLSGEVATSTLIIIATPLLGGGHPFCVGSLKGSASCPPHQPGCSDALLLLLPSNCVQNSGALLSVCTKRRRSSSSESCTSPVRHSA